MFQVTWYRIFRDFEITNLFVFPGYRWYDWCISSHGCVILVIRSNFLVLRIRTKTLQSVQWFELCNLWLWVVHILHGHPKNSAINHNGHSLSSGDLWLRKYEVHSWTLQKCNAMLSVWLEIDSLFQYLIFQIHSQVVSKGFSYFTMLKQV